MKYTIGHITQNPDGTTEQLGTRCYNTIPAKDDVVELELEGEAKYFKVKFVLHASYQEDDFQENSEPDLFVEPIHSPFK